MEIFSFINLELNRKYLSYIKLYVRLGEGVLSGESEVWRAERPERVWITCKGGEGCRKGKASLVPSTLHTPATAGLRMEFSMEHVAQSSIYACYLYCTPGEFLWVLPALSLCTLHPLLFVSFRSPSLSYLCIFVHLPVPAVLPVQTSWCPTK